MGLFQESEPEDSLWCSSTSQGLYLGCRGGYYQLQNTTNRRATVEKDSNGQLKDVNITDEEPVYIANDVDGFINQSYTRPCPPGYFCPNGFACIITCAIGGYCPVSEPIVNFEPNCESSLSCTIGNCMLSDDDPLEDPFSLESFGMSICPGSSFLHLCPEGHHCFRANQTEICPKGSTCPRGTGRRISSCDWMEECNKEGLIRPSYSLAMLIFIGFCVAVLTVGMCLFLFLSLSLLLRSFIKKKQVAQSRALCMIISRIISTRFEPKHLKKQRENC